EQAYQGERQAHQGERQARVELGQTNDELSRVNAQLAQALRERTEALEKQDRTFYFHCIALAQREWSANNVIRAEKVLEDCPGYLRNWEWHFLRRLCHTELLTIYAHTSPVSCLALSPDGQRLATGSYDQTLKVWDMKTGRE